ncbi:biopolymer transporter ExbD [Pirellulaceae bacterium SH449]
MSIPVTCPHCSSDLSVHDRMVGRETRCPRCGGVVLVPDISPEEESSEELVEAVALDDEDDVIDVVEVVDEDDSVDAVGEPVLQIAGRGHAKETAREAEDADVAEIEFPNKELPTDDMDMTPMVDVTFLLLIFFMITASFSSEKAFEEPPPLPTDAVTAEPKPNNDTIRIQIDEFNGYTIIFAGGDEREASSKQELLIALDEAKMEMATGVKDEELKLLIEAHVDCIHGAVIAAVDAARDRGFNGFQVQVVEEFQ